ncbi:hypothetical protein E2C01_048835 [Portunus trituberculatus]|uniref:Uncharacterized protein n=1 Tax=Portunus trituberculatus TaxID=210409 RepID=A0A5B7GBK9_PORTR|nr:hypothetical protein [Portunus trituberculatus]
MLTSVDAPLPAQHRARGREGLRERRWREGAAVIRPRTPLCPSHVHTGTTKVSALRVYDGACSKGLKESLPRTTRHYRRLTTGEGAAPTLAHWHCVDDMPASQLTDGHGTVARSASHSPLTVRSRRIVTSNTNKSPVLRPLEM